jgi:hypothetical protein
MPFFDMHLLTVQTSLGLEFVRSFYHLELGVLCVAWVRDSFAFKRSGQIALYESVLSIVHKWPFRLTPLEIQCEYFCYRVACLAYIRRDIRSLRSTALRACLLEQLRLHVLLALLTSLYCFAILIAIC